MRKFSMASKPSLWRVLVCFAAAVAALPVHAEDDVWRNQLSSDGRQATVSAGEDGFHVLVTGRDERVIAPQPAATETASLVFDAMFAQAQDELARSRVEQIRYDAFNDNKPLSCPCLVAGELWPWVWTRDIAYATDLGLFRFDPQYARNSLEFKLSRLRPGAASAGEKRDAGLYVVQDTGSGGSWPVSTDRVAWFLGARHLLGDKAFAAKTWSALKATLEQDRLYAFDPVRGLYRGETSFLDWREQSYPAWTARDVVYIAESFSLSTNVLHFVALQLAATQAEARKDQGAAGYRAQAAALRAAIDRQFWREDRGLYMSYLGPANTPQTIEAYDLLGTALAITSGVAPPAHARRALAGYPTWKDGTPVIWPERRDVPIYHNRAVWPFASIYALKAARALDEPARIAHELRSVLRFAALSGSNMENHQLNVPAPRTEQGADTPKQRAPGAAEPRPGTAEERRRPDERRVAGTPAKGAGPNARADRGPASDLPPKEWTGDAPGEHGGEPKKHGPVVNSRRQLWSVAAYLDLVVEGVFGLTDDGKVEPKLPRDLVPLLFGERNEISLKLPERRITLVKPAKLAELDNLLVAGTVSGSHADVRVQLRGTQVAASPLPVGRPAYAPLMPEPAVVERNGADWRIRGKATTLYVNGRKVGEFAGEASLPYGPGQQCISLTAQDADGIESLPSAPVCVGESTTVGGGWPRSWTAPRDGRYQARLDYENRQGPIMTGITTAVKILNVRCGDTAARGETLVMPHSDHRQASTAVTFAARSGQNCTFALEDGFNMSYLAHYTKYTGGAGGSGGEVNSADVGDLHIAVLP